MTISDADLNRMAWTMLGEAKPSDPNAMAAVGNVILNRYAAGGSYGKDITTITRPSQFTTWASTSAGGNDPMGRFPTSSPYFQRAKAIASQLVNGEIQDNTGGAVNYFAPAGMKNGATPSWAVGKNTLDIGGNHFIPLHPVSAGTQLVAQELPNAASVDAYSSTYGWASLPDADKATGAPITSVAQAQQSAASPGDAITAIEQAIGQPISGAPAPDALAYGSSLPVQQPAPLAQPSPAPAQPAVVANAAPIPGDRPAQLTGGARDQAALASIKNWLKGSNVNIDAVPAAQQAALVKALPTIASLQNDPKAELNYLQQSGLYGALTAAVPTHAPSFGESAWAAVNGIKLPAQIPDDLGSWKLPTGTDPNAALSAINSMVDAAGAERVPSYTPFDPNDPRGGPLAAPSANALSNWAAPYTSAFPSSGQGNSSAPAPSDNTMLSWATPYTSAFRGGQGGAPQPAFSPQPNFANTGADLTSLGVAPEVQVPQYITISKQVQVPDDQPIEQGSAGVVWDAASQSFKLQAAPPAAAPRMITRTVTQRVPNPRYVAPTAAPAANLPVTSTNGYNYLKQPNGSYLNVGQAPAAQGMTPAEQYAAAAARARASQPNGNVNNTGNAPGAGQANGSQMSHSLGGMPG